jgi:hypothetical protein
VTSGNEPSDSTPHVCGRNPPGLSIIVSGFPSQGKKRVRIVRTLFLPSIDLHFPGQADHSRLTHRHCHLSETFSLPTARHSLPVACCPGVFPSLRAIHSRAMSPRGGLLCLVVIHNAHVVISARTGRCDTSD